MVFLLLFSRANKPFLKKNLKLRFLKKNLSRAWLEEAQQLLPIEATKFTKARPDL